ncbi:MAG: hypothetical protein K2O67_04410, partial [Clostridia bacterium]|nr:hypothetical protein [Clostridia bacterium]
NYNGKFRAEVVFHAAGVEEPVPEPEQAGIPWWVWVLVGTVVVVIITLIVVIAIAVKNKKNRGGKPVKVDNSELKAQIAEQREKIDELLNRSDDGGFNTPVELDENGNVIFK